MLLGELDIAIERYQFIRRSIGAGIDMGNEFEALCRIGIGDLDGADALPVGWPTMRQYLVDPLIQWKRGEQPPVPDVSGTLFASEFVAYYCFAKGDIRRGFELLNSAIQSEEHPKHLIANRLLLIRHLFDKAVWGNPQFHEMLMNLGLDENSRKKIRASVTKLTPVTGIEARPLIQI